MIWIRRREFITLLGGAAVWPLAARAQQSERVRRVGVLLPAATDDLEFQPRLAAFPLELQRSGWGGAVPQAEINPINTRSVGEIMARFGVIFDQVQWGLPIGPYA